MTTALGGEGSTSRPGRFTPGKDPVPIVQEAGWAPRPVWTGVENLVHQPGFDSRTVQPVASRYTDYATRPGKKGKPVQITGVPAVPEGVQGHDHVAQAFVSLGTNLTCRLYKLTLSDPAQVILQLTARFSDICVKICSRFTLAGGPKMHSLK